MTPFLLTTLVLEDTPQKTIEAFVAAFNKGDVSGLSRRVMGQKPGKLPITPGSMSLKASIGKTTIAGGNATVQVASEIMASGRSIQKSNETVHLRRVGNDWQIVASAEEYERVRGEAINSISYVASHPDIFLQAKTAAKRTVCLSNVKQLALATLMYSADHKDILPKISAEWKAAIMPYVKNAAIFHCPDDNGKGGSYFLDPRVAGKPFAKIALPAQTAMVIEGVGGKAVFRHNGMAMLGFCDGHAKAVKPDKMSAARKVKL